MDGVKADLIFTDPPYNVDYLQAHGAFKGRRIQNDHMNPQAYLQFLQTAFASAVTVVKPEAAWYVCHASQFQDLVKQALESNHLLIRSQIIWAKNHFVLNRGRYKTQHEPIYYAYRKGQTDAWYGDRSQSTLWPFDKPLSCDLHPTMKPLALVQQALHNSSLVGDRVLDMFGGAGSTLIAAEHAHRQAYVVEIMPTVCRRDHAPLCRNTLAKRRCCPAQTGHSRIVYQRNKASVMESQDHELTESVQTKNR